MQIRVAHINAFTADGSGGNPAGVVLGADVLSDAQMLEIAKHVGFSETAFVSNSTEATRKVRFFTTTDEVDLCGHATIATWSYLFQQNILPSGSYTQDTRAGILKIKISENGLIYMEQAQATFYEKIDSADIAQVLNINTSDFHPSLKPQIVSTGLKDLLVPITSESVLDAIKPHFEAMTELSKRLDIVGVHVFAPLENSHLTAVARNFAPLFGIEEESATGTSNGALLCYLQKNSTLPSDQSEHIIEQGKAMAQTSRIYGKFIGENVWIGGHANVVSELTFDI